MEKISVIGNGFVGKAVVHGFKKKGAEVKVYDKFQDTDSLEEVAAFSDIIFLCLPTPYKGGDEEGRIDLGIIDETVEKISQIAPEGKIVVIKSTVVPGTTRKYAERYPKLHFCFNPEFLTEANYLEDFLHADRTVVGADDPDMLKKMSGLYAKHFPETPIIDLDTISAELTKYMANTFLATKVMFANEMFDLAEKVGADYEKVKQAVVADKRIGESHLKIGPNRGFGGKCFPKDIVALLGLYKEVGVSAELLETVWKKNLAIRKNRDWEDIPFVKS